MKILCFALLCLATFVPAAVATGDDCTVTIDFHKLPNGTVLQGGTYLSDEWYDAYGLTLSASGGYSKKPRLFNTSDVGTKKFGDPDLGSPNERCLNPGPGKGEGGEPDSLGANCKPLGNVLIIQEDNAHLEIPDDSVDGGVISFKFNQPVQISKIGLLDIDYKSSLRVYLFEQGSEDIPIPTMGDNSAQTISINKYSVEQLDVNLGRSGAVTSLSFCYQGFARIGEICYGGNDACETGYCFFGEDENGMKEYQVGICSCDPEAQLGCNDEEEEECIFSPLADGGPPVCVRTAGAACYDHSDCVTNFCFIGPFPPPGVCSCNPTTGQGCNGDFICAGSNDLVEALGIFDYSPRCKLPIGAACDPQNGNDCLTANCDEVTNVCSCSLLMNYPCDTKKGEICLLQNIGYVCKVPFPIGSDCTLGTECETGFCHIFTHGFSGTCSRCDIKSGEGCEKGFVCFDVDELEEILGEVAFLPECFLPYEAPCDPLELSCVTGNCPEVTNQCSCNVHTGYPCDVESGERCSVIGDGSFACIVAEIGDGSLGSYCVSDNDCDSGSCFQGPSNSPQGSRAICVCDTALNDGCFGQFICVPGPELFQAQLLSDSPPMCLLPVGSACYDDAECVTDNCDAFTGLCSCNQATNYPCENGENCAITAGGVYACIEIGDGSIGSSCIDGNDCDSGRCYYNPQIPEDSPGFCVCNTDSNKGCFGEFLCASGDDLFEARFLADASPGCYLPVGAMCDPMEDSCLTGNCDGTTKLCTCSYYPQYGCDKEAGEICARKNGQMFCKVPSNEPIGEACVNNKDCIYRACFYHGLDPPGTPGTCTCNLDTNAGCEGEFICYSPSDLEEVQLLADASQGCFLPFGATCDPEQEPDDIHPCITGNCDIETSKCGCNDRTSFPCDTDAGEVCRVRDGSYRCGFPPECPKPDPTTVCPAVALRVKCQECEYLNQCEATSADPQFTANTCVRF